MLIQNNTHFVEVHKSEKNLSEGDQIAEFKTIFFQKIELVFKRDVFVYIKSKQKQNLKKNTSP